MGNFSSEQTVAGYYAAAARATIPAGSITSWLGNGSETIAGNPTVPLAGTAAAGPGLEPPTTGPAPAGPGPAPGTALLPASDPALPIRPGLNPESDPGGPPGSLAQLDNAAGGWPAGGAARASSQRLARGGGLRGGCRRQRSRLGGRGRGNSRWAVGGPGRTGPGPPAAP